MLTLERRFVKEIIAHALEDDPNECCGIIAGQDGDATKLYRAINAEASPYRYNIESKDLLRIYRDIEANDWEILAIYHSHTHTVAYPSPTDVRTAALPEPYYLIVSLVNVAQPLLRAFRIREGKISRQRLRVPAEPLPR